MLTAEVRLVDVATVEVDPADVGRGRRLDERQRTGRHLHSIGFADKRPVGGGGDGAIRRSRGRGAVMAKPKAHVALLRAIDRIAFVTDVHRFGGNLRHVVLPQRHLHSGRRDPHRSSDRKRRSERERDGVAPLRPPAVCRDQGLRGHRLAVDRGYGCRCPVHKDGPLLRIVRGGTIVLSVDDPECRAEPCLGVDRPRAEELRRGGVPVSGEPPALAIQRSASPNSLVGLSPSAKTLT